MPKLPGELTLTPLMWLAAGVYRGLYEWDGPGRAEAYARALWRVLDLVSMPGSDVSDGWRLVEVT